MPKTFISYATEDAFFAELTKMKLSDASKFGSIKVIYAPEKSGVMQLIEVFLNLML